MFRLDAGSTWASDRGVRMFESINKSTVSQSQKLITGPSPVLLRMCVEHSVTSDTFLKRPQWAEVCEMERSPGGEEKNLCWEAEGTQARCVAIWQLHSNTADPVIQRRKWICSLAPEWRAATNGLKFRGRQILDQLKKECYKQLNSPNMECTVFRAVTASRWKCLSKVEKGL